MSFADLLINICTIRRYTDLGADSYGNPTKDWSNLPVAYNCRISYPKGRQIMRNTEVVPVDAVLFMEDNVITEADRVIVDGIEYEILFVADLQDAFGEHHLEVSLIRVKP